MAGVLLGLAVAGVLVQGVIALLAGPRWLLVSAIEAFKGWAVVLAAVWLAAAAAHTVVRFQRLHDPTLVGWRLWAVRMERSYALDTLESALLDSCVQTLAEILNDEIEAETGTILTVRGIPGLGDLSDPSYDIETDAVKRLARLVRHLEGGTIGIAGPRGVGKTTLIRGFHEGRWGRRGERRRVGVLVSAPVQYEPRDFVLHLFDALCQELLGQGQVERVRTDAFADLERRHREEFGGLLLSIGTLLLAGGCGVLAFKLLEPKIGATAAAALPLLAAGAVGLIAGMAVRLKPHPDDDPRETPGVPELSFVAALPPVPGVAAVRFVVSLDWALNERLTKWVTSRSWYPRFDAGIRLLNRRGLVPVTPPRPSESRDAVLERMAREHLRAIKFQQTYTSGWSGSLKVAAAATVGADAKLSLARTQMSLPEVVERFRRFVAEVGMDRDVVIGIDELDKMESALVARRFLNDVKGVFGVSGCYYLISVSEDAMSAFERRGLPLRDVFDSSLDDIVRVGQLTLDESELVLKRRAISLPYPYHCMCHCLSAGLPRDLIRAARLLLPAGVPKSPERMNVAGRRVMEAELAGKLEAAKIAARDCGDPDAWHFLRWLRVVEQTPVNGPALIERCAAQAIAELIQRPAQERNAGGDNSDRSVGLAELAGEIATYLYYAATMLEYFTDELDLAWMKDHKLPQKVSPEVLAEARRELGASWILAWDRVSGFRTTAKLGNTVAPPLPPTKAPA